jgi:NADH dehydrogenase (ubiquinone) 1 alpha subcomplex subunit 4
MGGEAKGKLFEVQMLKQVKSNYSLYPLVFIGALGMGLAGFQIIRSLVRSPDIHFNRRNNPDPWNKLMTEDGKYVQFKYFTTLDYKSLAANSERPKLD